MRLEAAAREGEAAAREGKVQIEEPMCIHIIQLKIESQEA